MGKMKDIDLTIRELSKSEEELNTITKEVNQYFRGDISHKDMSMKALYVLDDIYKDFEPNIPEEESILFGGEEWVIWNSVTF